eukprot:scaffold164055_cov34-Tisochrysis_lutea.AAC.2
MALAAGRMEWMREEGPPVARAMKSLWGAVSETAQRAPLTRRPLASIASAAAASELPRSWGTVALLPRCCCSHSCRLCNACF